MEHESLVTSTKRHSSYRAANSSSSTWFGYSMLSRSGWKVSAFVHTSYEPGYLTEKYLSELQSTREVALFSVVVDFKSFCNHAVFDLSNSSHSGYLSVSIWCSVWGSQRTSCLYCPGTQESMACCYYCRKNSLYVGQPCLMSCYTSRSTRHADELFPRHKCSSLFGYETI